jgi:hypothetical protein
VEVHPLCAKITERGLVIFGIVHLINALASEGELLVDPAAAWGRRAGSWGWVVRSLQQSLLTLVDPGAVCAISTGGRDSSPRSPYARHAGASRPSW